MVCHIFMTSLKAQTSMELLDTVTLPLICRSHLQPKNLEHPYGCLRPRRFSYSRNKPDKSWVLTEVHWRAEEDEVVQHLAPSSDNFSRTAPYPRWKRSSELISFLLLVSKYHLAHSVLSALFYQKELILFFFFFCSSFPQPDRSILFVAVCPKSSASSECERFEVTDKKHFSNQHFFPKRFFRFKRCFSLFISVLKVLPSWFLSQDQTWGRRSLQNWLDKPGNYNVEHAALWNVL